MVKVSEGILYPPSTGWGEREYVVVVSAAERGSVGSSVSELGSEERRESGLGERDISNYVFVCLCCIFIPSL